MTRQVRIGITGAAGRMGRMLIRQVVDSDGAVLAAALERPGSEWLGQDAGALIGAAPLGVALTDDADALMTGCDVVIDFSSPSLTTDLAGRTRPGGAALVVGTTGLRAEHHAALDQAAGRVAVMQAPNMSVGVVLLSALVEQTAAILGPDYDIEVVEMHHRHKVDAPSGTALGLGEAAARGRKVALEQAAVRVRDGITGPREAGTIGFATLRGGDVIGDHTVLFAGVGERVELTHKATNREVFARGAVRAALWAANQSAGRYSMRDVLGL